MQQIVNKHHLSITEPHQEIKSLENILLPQMNKPSLKTQTTINHNTSTNNIKLNTLNKQNKQKWNGNKQNGTQKGKIFLIREKGKIEKMLDQIRQQKKFVQNQKSRRYRLVDRAYRLFGGLMDVEKDKLMKDIVFQKKLQKEKDLYEQLFSKNKRNMHQIQQFVQDNTKKYSSKFRKRKRTSLDEKVCKEEVKNQQKLLIQQATNQQKKKQNKENSIIKKSLLKLRPVLARNSCGQKQKQEKKIQQSIKELQTRQSLRRNIVKNVLLDPIQILEAKNFISSFKKINSCQRNLEMSKVLMCRSTQLKNIEPLKHSKYDFY